MQPKKFREVLSQWEQIHSFGRKPSTQKFNGEIVRAILRLWPDENQFQDAISSQQIVAFGAVFLGYCPSRWNAMVSALRFISPHGALLDFRAVRMRDFLPPTQVEFAKLLSQCDSAPRSHAGFFVRFLCLTGARITEARGIRWRDVFADRVEVPAAVSKNGKRRGIPRLEGMTELLSRLKIVSDGEFVLPRENARKAIQSACRRAGIVNMSHHCFRHYFATRCIESGVDIPTVARWLGHTDGGALLSKTYFHLLDSHSHAMAAKVKIAA